MAHIDTETTWKDSGYDCDHCGGRVWRRTDRETGRPAQTCLQCEGCGCQWSLKGTVKRVGDLEICRQAKREREATGENPYPLPPLVIVLIGLVLLVLLVMIGGLTAVRYLIPVGIAVFVGVALYRYIRERMEKM